ncbi:MAG: SGNH/GDSL hydrolase family protein [Lachnospiraceae bacterium]|nr:SGNH/GDSL hydrolase family protein [Lachnospiraceae bacterium]
MAGPKAPKDPTAKGSNFYICRQKEVAGNPTPDGRGVQFIYLDGERLTTFAKMVGSVTDETMINNLRSAEGFLSMVAGIGVTVEAQDADNAIDFVFQMYGKRDTYGSGDQLRVRCRPDGMEQIIWLDDHEWGDDNAVVGQMRFEFEKPGTLATIDVKLYLREGFEAPEQEERTEIRVESEAYQAILGRSLMNLGNYARVKRVLDRAKRGEEVTIAFIGGSITQGAGATPIDKKAYAYQTWERFKENFGENVKLIKAGVGGTPSELGMIRFERDVLRGFTVKPDLIVIEFSVNDEGDETKGLCYESLVRKCLAMSDDTAVILIHAVFADDWNLEERLGPVGERYEVPMVSVRQGVVPQFYLKPDTGRVLTKSQFFYDVYHPTNMGHTIMADCLIHLMKKIDQSPEIADVDWRSKEPYFGADFENVELVDRAWKTELLMDLTVGSFLENDADLQRVEMDDQIVPVPEFPNNWHHAGGSEAFSAKISCKSLLIVVKDSGSPEYGKAIVKVDGKEVLTLDPRIVGWTHCTPLIIWRGEQTMEHKIEVSMIPGDEDKKMTILGFGVVR